ncbi:hypothetical protein A3K63_01950 [Candidatus Micrarchaeota archaeon RBG_16_49_10]|nr:MAG: hypothetical protein A3K63_01950 [Candidatus Micrarchaeota archaeon RBG_16_49_10]
MGGDGARLLRTLALAYEGEEFKDTLTLPVLRYKDKFLADLRPLSEQFGFQVSGPVKREITITWNHLPTDDEVQRLCASLGEMTYGGVRYSPSLWR